MMKPEHWAYAVVFAALFGAPLLAVPGWLLLRRAPAALRAGLMVAAALPPLLALLLWRAGLWLWSFEATLGGLALAWAALGLLTALAFALPRPRGLWLGGALALLLAGGAFVGGIGAPLVLFTVGDLMPAQVVRLPSGATCHVTPFGNAASYGYHVRLREPLAALPLLTRALHAEDVPAAQTTPQAACAQVAARVPGR
jgi:hypothetical protein